MQKNVTISIDEDINALWTKTAKKHEISKSRMIEDFLREILPILNESTPNKMMFKAMKKMAEGIDDSASLFEYDERAIYDQSVEDYKKSKRGKNNEE